ncbi:hypothetical protein BJ875DRAFT_439857 [Amylocarpus encephaloides]|uniref:Uncharacterized protein n=1 Tax=Amylocarpus encephaloides TaxID=45428 RepID=A0A9P8C759_9HELO|nr:hypothetical protein BJ875DRAFT_439857 [Amylocarpus encephaloides]
MEFSIASSKPGISVRGSSRDRHARALRCRQQTKEAAPYLVAPTIQDPLPSQGRIWNPFCSRGWHILQVHQSSRGHFAAEARTRVIRRREDTHPLRDLPDHPQSHPRSTEGSNRKPQDAPANGVPAWESMTTASIPPYHHSLTPPHWPRADQGVPPPGRPHRSRHVAYPYDSPTSSHPDPGSTEHLSLGHLRLSRDSSTRLRRIDGMDLRRRHSVSSWSPSSRVVANPWRWRGAGARVADLDSRLRRATSQSLWTTASCVLARTRARRDLLASSSRRRGPRPTTVLPKLKSRYGLHVQQLLPDRTAFLGRRGVGPRNQGDSGETIRPSAKPMRGVDGLRLFRAILPFFYGHPHDRFHRPCERAYGAKVHGHWPAGSIDPWLECKASMKKEPPCDRAGPALPSLGRVTWELLVGGVGGPGGADFSSLTVTRRLDCDCGLWTLDSSSLGAIDSAFNMYSGRTLVTWSLESGPGDWPPHLP